MRVKWTPKAPDNLDSALDYIAADKPAAATDVALKILKSVNMLADQPGYGASWKSSGY